MRNLWWYGIPLVVWGIIGLSEGQAQVERYELGLRLRSLETAWDQYATPEARRRAVPFLKQSVNSFFRLRLGEAGKALTEARAALRSATPAPADERWAGALFLKLDKRLLDTKEKELGLTLAAFYSVEGGPPKDARLRVNLVAPGGKIGPSIFETEIAGLPLEKKVPLRNVGEGDYKLRAEILSHGQVLVMIEQAISCADRLAGRLEMLKQAVAGWSDDPATTDRESAKALVRLLEALANKRTLETDYPAARLLVEAEALVKAVAEGKPYHGKTRTGEFWLTLACPKGSVPARVLVPEVVKKGAAWPLVLALHGAGGSENLFFDGYGNGAAVNLCRERGWLLVAPRAGGFGAPSVAEILDAAAKLYPVDAKRVFLVGHSMGAAQSVAAVQQTPDRFAGVAAVGGGGFVRQPKGLERMPFFVGVGAEDFALRNARALADQLEKAGVAKVEWKEYPDVEHLAIVQVALRDVFRFFDRVADR